jgi:hypothetical protein
MNSWQFAWRNGIAPQLSTAGLEALAKALADDDKALIQNASIFPPPLQCVADWPVEAACSICLAGWKGDGLKTVGEVEEYFALVCYEAGNRLGDPSGARYFLNWHDETLRADLRSQLLPEVQRELARRSGTATAA